MGRAPCCDKANVKKGPWSPEEDAKLKSFIEKHGTGGNWITLPQKMGLKRCGKSCRLRWLNYLRPNIKHGGFTEEEDDTICNLYLAIGSRWSIIASQLPGRTDNDIKNYWNTRLKKKLLVGRLQRKAEIIGPQQLMITGSGRNLQLQAEARKDHSYSNYRSGSLLLSSSENHSSSNLMDPAAAMATWNSHQQHLSQIFRQAMSMLGGEPRPDDQEHYEHSQNGNYFTSIKMDPFLELLGQLPHSTTDHDGLRYGKGFSGTANTGIITADYYASAASMNWDEVINY